ncbi:MAG: hypothetical protein HZC42_05935 [Candidatus Eisenbacteria bacterium]|nr:hypothetical protein [Candidatus Eisenbacteria bacterium]
MEKAGSPADASTLIYLAKAEAFELAWKCVGRLAVPPSVWRESVEAGDRKGAVEVARIRLAHESGLVRRVQLSTRTATRAREIAARYLLGSGESEVLALGGRGGRVIVDEGRATRVAESLGLVPVSTLFLPVLGAARGRLGEPSAVELLRRLAGITGARADVTILLERLIRRNSR